MEETDEVTSVESYNDSYDSDSNESILSANSNSNIESVHDQSSYDFEEISLFERLEKMDGKWEIKSKYRCDEMFYKECSPNVSDYATSPLDLFFCLVSNDFLDHLVIQTNVYIKQHKKKNFLTREELLKFLGINILMDIKKLPYRDYWSTNQQLNDPYISAIMPFNRFSFIMSHLHINDNEKEPNKEDLSYNKLYKIRPMITCLNKNFKNCFKPNMHQNLDESIVKFKGRSTLKQYNPMKPIKHGYKLWVRADKTGYICEFQEIQVR